MEHPEDADAADVAALDAGPFSRWLDGMQAALRGDADSHVPCGGCTACCTSSQFVHIAPDETETLNRIPKALLFPAPGLPRGHMVLGYDQRGRCPMLVDDRCTIYDHRPRTCRTYDCRIYPAAGVEVDSDKELIAARVRRWRFSFPSEEDVVRAAAVRAAASSPLTRSAGGNGTRRAVMAIEVHGVFLARDPDTGGEVLVIPDAEPAALEVDRARGR